MDETNTGFAGDEPIFQALLAPHRSLGRTGFAVLMGTLLFGWLITGAFFLSRGAWPVFGFFGLDVLLVDSTCRATAAARRAAPRARSPMGPSCCRPISLSSWRRAPRPTSS